MPEAICARAQWMVWAVGLRGAVAYGLALNLPQIEGESDEGIPAIESATLVIVMASTLFLGAATGPLLRVFDLQASILEASSSSFAVCIFWAFPILARAIMGAQWVPLQRCRPWTFSLGIASWSQIPGSCQQKFCILLKRLRWF